MEPNKLFSPMSQKAKMAPSQTKLAVGEFEDFQSWETEFTFLERPKSKEPEIIVVKPGRNHKKLGELF